MGEEPSLEPNTAVREIVTLGDGLNADVDVEKNDTSHEQPHGSKSCPETSPEAYPPGPDDATADLEPVHSSRSIYNRFTPRRKTIILFVLSFCGFVTPIASTAVLVAIPEVAATFQTTGVIINVSNGLFFVFMALSPIFWGPLAQTSFGRRNVFIVSSILLTAFSAGTAAAPNVAAYFIFRMLTAFQGTAYLVVGSVVIGDVFHPSERGRALSVFMMGILVGPSVAPLLGGVVITYTSWRIIFWAITGLSAVSSALIIFLLPETIPEMPENTFKGLKPWQVALTVAKLTNPWKVVRPLLAYPNLWIAALAVSSMIWNQYSLLTPIRYVINPRFQLTTPIQSALFFLPPGAGYLFGVLFGGRWSDWVVARYTARHGRRIPEDRLRAAAPLMLVAIPAFTIIYGWAIDKEVGGIPLVVISMFLQGVTQQLALPSINTYLVECSRTRARAVWPWLGITCRGSCLRQQERRRVCPRSG
jgi:multidrug resistance protein